MQNLTKFGHLLKMQLKEGNFENRVVKEVDLQGDPAKKLHWRQPCSV